LQGGFNHEGDWERVTIKLNASNVPTMAHFYRHRDSCGRDVSWSAVEKDLLTGRPVVFIANGSHGSYHEPKSNPVTCLPIPYPADVTGYGARWETWRSLHDVTQQSWYGFGGAWGVVGNGPTPADTTGPLGPSRYKPPAPPGW
jgi:hypothetical protein